MSEEITNSTFNKYELEAKRDGTRLAEEISRMINRSYEKVACQAFADQLLYRTHRTLQQGTGNLFLTVIKQAAKEYDKGNYDLRNEFFYKWCKEVIEKTDCEFNFPTI